MVSHTISPKSKTSQHPPALPRLITALDQKLKDAQQAYDAFAESRAAAGDGKRDQQILARIRIDYYTSDIGTCILKEASIYTYIYIYLYIYIYIYIYHDYIEMYIYICIYV